MKKLLVVLMAAVMVLSMAAVSMAAATVEGDWRAEWVQQDKVNNDDLGFSKYDLRFNFKGKVSDTIDAYLQIAYDSGVVTKTDKDPLGFAVKEYKVNFKQSWGTLTAGSWDHKLFPSRVLLKPHGDNKVRDDNMQFVFDIPVGDAFKFALFMDPDLSKDAMDYDLTFGYKGDGFGAEVHYGEKDPSKKDSTYMAFDAYYKIDAFKLFVYGIDAGDDYKGAWKDAKGSIGLVPVIGAEYKSGAITTSFEYTLEEASKDYSPYGLKFAYGFNNKVTLEVEYTNVDKDNNKIVIRPRVKF